MTCHTDSWLNQQTSYRANSSLHPQCKSCHSPRIGCWYFPIMCNGLCTSRRFHTQDDNQKLHQRAKISWIAFVIIKNVHALQPFSPISGYTTSSHKQLVVVSKMGSWYCVLSMLVCMHTAIITATKTTQVILKIAWRSPFAW